MEIESGEQLEFFVKEKKEETEPDWTKPVLLGLPPKPAVLLNGPSEPIIIQGGHRRRTSNSPGPVLMDGKSKAFLYNGSVRRFICQWPNCLVKSHNKADALDHYYVHLGIKTHFCKKCHKGFTNGSNYRRHSKWSACYRPEGTPCPVKNCEKVFFSYDGWKRHQTDVHHIKNLVSRYVSNK